MLRKTHLSSVVPESNDNSGELFTGINVPTSLVDVIPPDYVRPLWKLIPTIWPAIVFSWRLEKLFVFSSQDIKEGLLMEWQTHVVVDSLLMTIASQPIFSGGFEEFSVVALLTGIFMYLTVMIQLMSIVCHIVCICCIIELPRTSVNVWAMDNKEAIRIVAVIHVTGFYFFVACLILWPLLYFNIYIAFICIALVVVIGTSVFSSHGIGGYIMKSFYPNIMLSFNPKDDALRKRAVKELEFLWSHSEIPRECGAYQPLQSRSHVGSLELFLASIQMSHYLGTFKQENIISVDMLMDLSPSDFHQLGVKIGDRVVILRECKRLLNKEVLCN